MSSNIIEINNLNKSFGKKKVLKDVSFSVKKGDIFALLGSNGAGKSTLIKILSTLIRQDSGNIIINGLDVIENEREVRKCISLTGQFVAVDEVLTGRENLNIIGKLKRLNNLKEIIERWLDFFDLKDVADQKVSTYSGGMHRRLDIAMSLMGKPEIIFLDEPTTGLDPQNRKAMWDFVKSLSKEGMTVFLTTQYLEEAEYLANNIAILHEGRIITQGTTQYLKKILPIHGFKIKFNNEEIAQKAIVVLKQNGIAIDGIEQELPSLEEVFLSLVAKNEEEINERD